MVRTIEIMQMEYQVISLGNGELQAASKRNGVSLTAKRLIAERETPNCSNRWNGDSFSRCEGACLFQMEKKSLTLFLFLTMHTLNLHTQLTRQDGIECDANDG